MLNATSYNCMTKCLGECTDCPFDEDMFPEKNRSASRKRHLNKEKEKQREKKNAEILYSKAGKILSAKLNDDIKMIWKKSIRIQRRVANYS